MKRALVAIVAVVATLIMLRHERRSTRDACRFEQTWYQGDVHFDQTLVFDASGDGHWTTGGMASDAPRKRLWFSWHRDGSTLTAVFGPQSRTVHYAIADRGSSCDLTLDDVFLPDDGQARHYSNRR